MVYGYRIVRNTKLDVDDPLAIRRRWYIPQFVHMGVREGGLAIADERPTSEAAPRL